MKDNNLSMTASTYSVQFVGSAKDIPDTLWDACFPPPLEGRWWYETMEASGLDDQFTFLYGLIRDGDRPVGIAPAFIMNVPIDIVAPEALVPALRYLGKYVPSVLYQRTLFIGSPCSDEGTVGFIEGVDRRQALIHLQTGLEKKARECRAPMIVWKDFPEGPGQDLDWLTRQTRLFRLTSFPSTLVQFSSSKKEDYFSSMKASRRQKLKRKLRHSVSNADVTVEVVQYPDAAVLDDVFALFWQTYSKATLKFEKLNKAWFENIATKDVSRFLLLRERGTGKLVAFMLCFEAGDRLINKFIGIDYTKPRDWLLYFRLWDAAVDWALARGFSSIQSGQTVYAPKIEVGHSLIPLTNYCRHRNFVIHAVYRAVAKTIDWRSLDNDLAIFLAAHPEGGAIIDTPGHG